MVARFISSLQHPIVKHLVKLREKKSYRSENKSVVISGDSLIKDLSSRFTFKTLILLEGSSLPVGVAAENVYIAPLNIIKKITEVESPETLVAEIELPTERSLEGKKRILVLDKIVDPGNLGTLFRTALALGFEGIFLVEGCCDPYNDKALRAAKGATFFLPFAFISLTNLIQYIEENAFNAYVADLGGTELRKEAFQYPLMLILGNETHGPSPELKSKFKRITITHDTRVESLNVATAGAICMYIMRGDHV